MRAFVATPPGTWFAKRIASKLDPVLLRLTGGRMSTAIGFPTVNLTTTGRRSGEPRTTTLLYFTRGDDVVLIASRFGNASHPAWYLNLTANPEAELVARGRRGTYVAREVSGPERDELYSLAVRMYRGYGQYEDLAGDRTIPVLVLTPSGR
jgi:deazaflavin-dependent oxidoreductase (nitroreductase family)